MLLGDSTIEGVCVICSNEIAKPKRGPVGKTCSNSCRKTLSRRVKPVTPLTLVSKTCDTLPEQPYTASNIVIMGASERMSNPMFDWELAEELARDFTCPVDWIRRSILACREADVSPQYFIDRYLHKKPIEMNRDVDKAARAL